MTVSTVLPGVDLVPENLVLAPGPAVQSGGSVTVQWSTRNTGTLATTGSWTDRVVVRNTGTNEVLADLLIPYDATVSGPIAAGGTASRQATFALPDGPRGAGTISVTVTVDVSNEVIETNSQGTAELNNAATFSFASVLAPYPDLIPTGLTLTPAVGWLAGDSLTISWTTRNDGDGPTTGSWDETVRIRNLGTGQTLLTLHVRVRRGRTRSDRGRWVARPQRHRDVARRGHRRRADRVHRHGRRRVRRSSRTTRPAPPRPTTRSSRS